MSQSASLWPSQWFFRAIQEAPIPQKVSELKSYSGLLSPNMADVLAPLHALHGKEVNGGGQRESRKPLKPGRVY